MEKTIMKKFLVLLVSLGFSLHVLPAFDRAKFDGVVDFSVTLKELTVLVKNPTFNPESFSKILIFDGSIATITYMDKEPASFSAELEIVNGEWKGTETVELFKSFIYVGGPGFAKRLPVRRPKELPPDIISLNDHVLIVGRIVDVYVDEKQDRFPVVEAFYVRVMK